MIKKSSLTVVILFFTLFLSGCGTKSLVENQMEKNLEKNLGGDTEVDLNNGAISVQTKDGSLQVGGRVSLPEGFPNDVYIVEGQILSAMQNFGSVGYQVIISTSKSIAETQKLYNEKLKNEGWAIQNTMNLGTSFILSAVKDTRTLSVSIGDGDEAGVVSVIITITNNK